MKEAGYLKAKAILADAFGERADRLDPGVFASATMDAIKEALAPRLGKDIAGEIAFHMSDWNSEAAFILALHLFPEKFTKEEIEDGISDFLTHAPNHIAKAAGLIGCPVSDIFKDED